MTQRRCLSCDADAPPDARFCGRCGAALTEAADLGDVADPITTVPTVVGPTSAATPAPPGPTADVGPTLVVPGSGPGDWSATVEARHHGRDGHGRRRLLAGAALAVVAVAAMAVVTRPAQDAIVLGDGLLLGSGAGPADRPTRLWSVDVAVSDPVPPVVVDDTIVLGGSSDDVAVVVGVDVTSGRSLWRVPLGLDLDVLAVLPSDDDVITVASDGEATAVARHTARSGQPVWPARTVLFGGADAATALPEGRVLVELAATAERRGRAVVLDAAGQRVLDVEADVIAAAADLVAVADGDEVRTFAPGGDPVAVTAVDDAPVDALAVAGGLVVVAHDDSVDASDARTGAPRWSISLGDPVVALAPSAVGVAAITLGDHVGLGFDGGQRWRDDGYPLPLVRDGDHVTALVAPGVEDAVVVEVVAADGRPLSSTGVREGQYVALGRATVITALADVVVGTAVDGGTPPWRVTTAGDVRWVVLDGPRMVVSSAAGGETSLSSWR